jgi:putative Mg2+ transporter-C (MgtC) family protein
MPLELEILIRVLTAGALGAIIGFQRERAHKPAGLRTHIFICMGSALFTVISIYGFGSGSDPSRVAAGIVAGIGFLGAGVIFRSMGGKVVVGLTTAASVWIAAAIGMASGVGMYFIAVVVTIIAFLVLYIPKAKG